MKQATVRICKSAMTLLLMLVAIPAAQAVMSVSQDWATTVTQGGSAGMYGAMVAVDSAGYIYVTGSNPWQNVITAKYDQMGHQIWQRDFRTTDSKASGKWIATTPDGGVVVAGSTTTSFSVTGLLTLRYDAAGNLLWSDIIPNVHGQAVRVAVDAQGNAYVIGIAWLTNASGSTTDDMLTIKYTPSGARAWTRALGFDNTSSDSANSLAIRPNGNVLVTGGAVGWFVTGEYDPAGNLQWSSRVSASGGAGDIALGPGGVSYAVGNTYTPSTGNQFYVVKYSSTGAVLWSKMYPGTGARRVAVDSAGNVIVTGYTSVYSNWLTYKLNPAGTQIWSQVYDRHRFNDEFPYFMTIGPQDEIYITGQGGPGPVSGELSYLKTVTVRYSPSGTEDWVTYTDASVRGLGVSRGPTGTIAVVGESPFVVYHFTQSSSTDPTFPGGVSGLIVRRNPNGSDLDLTWNPACGTARDFAVYEGTLGSWYSHSAVTCTTGGVLRTTFKPGTAGRYYLITPLQVSQEGNYGNSSSGAPLPPAAVPCMSIRESTSCP